MHSWPRAALKDRAAAATLTLAVHALLLLLLLEKHKPREQQLPELVSLPIFLPPLQRAPPVEAPEVRQIPLRADVPAPAAAPPIMPPPPVTPTPSPQAAAEQPAPRVDWYAEMARVGEAAGAESGGPRDFSAPVTKMREPCKPRDSSFEWSAEEKKAGLLPLPYVIIAERCMITIGFFTCVFGELPPPNAHLFDDMQEGKTPDSSVPDPNFCD